MKQRDELLVKFNDHETSSKHYYNKIDSVLERLKEQQAKYHPLVDMHNSAIKKLEGLEEATED